MQADVIFSTNVRYHMLGTGFFLGRRIDTGMAHHPSSGKVSHDTCIPSTLIAVCWR